MITEDDIQGHWVREWIRAPGFEDHTTAVHWMQVGMDYADIRVPLDRPEYHGASCLAELPPQSLLQLAAAEGFAGHTTLDGTQCTWHREINWHGTPDGPDIGALSFTPEGTLIEEGVEATYTELWHPRAKAEGRAFRVSGSGYTGILLTRGTSFVLGIGRPDKPSTQRMIAALRAGDMPEDLADLFDDFHAYGFWTGTEAIARVATHPFCEGRVVARLTDDGLIWDRIGFDGVKAAITLAGQSSTAMVGS